MNAVPYPEIAIFVGKLPELPGNYNTVHCMSQKMMLWKAHQQWGPSPPIEDDLGSPNTRIRMFGLALCDQYRDDLNVLTRPLFLNRLVSI